MFYGRHTPPIEGINSSSNHMFLIFKSDKNISYTGFSALYKAVDCLGNHCNLSSKTSKFTPSLINSITMPYSFGTTMLSSDTKPTVKSSLRRLAVTSQKIDSPVTLNKTSTSKADLMVASSYATTGFSGGNSVMTTSKEQQFVVSSTRKPIVTSISTELLPTSSKIQLASSSSVTGPVFVSGMKLFKSGCQ